jgi:hypothetical protein
MSINSKNCSARSVWRRMLFFISESGSVDNVNQGMYYVHVNVYVSW